MHGKMILEAVAAAVMFIHKSYAISH